MIRNLDEALRSLNGVRDAFDEIAHRADESAALSRKLRVDDVEASARCDVRARAYSAACDLLRPWL